MTLTKNLYYSGPSEPGEKTLVPASLNEFISIRTVNGSADTANLYAGLLVYPTGTTNANDVTECPVDYGSVQTHGPPFLVDIEISNSDFFISTDKPHPTRIPNDVDVSGTIANYKYAANQPVKLVEIKTGMYFWAPATLNKTGAFVAGTRYKHLANGLLGATADPDGILIDKNGYMYECVATIATQNWALMKALGLVAFDDTAV